MDWKWFLAWKLIKCLNLGGNPSDTINFLNLSQGLSCFVINPCFNKNLGKTLFHPGKKLILGKAYRDVKGSTKMLGYMSPEIIWWVWHFNFCHMSKKKQVRQGKVSWQLWSIPNYTNFSPPMDALFHMLLLFTTNNLLPGFYQSKKISGNSCQGGRYILGWNQEK